jgi:hypothetical protein
VDAREQREKDGDETVDDSSSSFNRRIVRGKEGGDVQSPFKKGARLLRSRQDEQLEKRLTMYAEREKGKVPNAFLSVINSNKR